MSYALIRQIRRAALVTQQFRAESTLTNLTHEDLVFRPSLAHWGKVIREAEKIVGYPTSFMNLRWLLSDEFANLAMHLRKVVDTNHPIIKTAKTLIYNEHNNQQPWGLVILLLSKAVTIGTTLQANKTTENQRVLAELTEMIRTGHYVHRGLLNISIEKQLQITDTAMFANKVAILIGDYLLVTANGMLARLKNQDLSYLISTALRDISEGEFFGERDSQNMPLPGKPMHCNKDEFLICTDTLPLDVMDTLGSPIREWTLRTLYSGGTLLGRGCQGAMLLGDQGLQEQENAYLFGCHLCLAWQAATDLQKLTSDNKEPFSLVSAPVLFALNENPDLYYVIEKGRLNVSDVDCDELKDKVLQTNAVEKTKELYYEHVSKAESHIEKFGNSQAITTIKQLIKTL
ncbi:all trans-polyprenyl-diphosphate synthase PDSS2-like [Plodia interpunctella]|uniref:all trans-polyprenyl-diphosphate synthase PDSS2-like n=1 Tax=Plodia interpunctella TaxID=58824 RepID=UPI002368613D|nr:all trans-polyprenyl-diphosphate synthase PDSS2-like [Plodia interpunctella]